MTDLIGILLVGGFSAICLAACVSGLVLVRQVSAETDRERLVIAEAEVLRCALEITHAGCVPVRLHDAVERLRALRGES